MTLPDGSHVVIGSQAYLLDEGYEQLTGRRCYVHGGRSIFSGRTDITGKPGAQNLLEDKLVWSMTDFTGEGQVVLDPSDDTSAFRFYRSEGLDFRTQGQISLNKSIVSETMASGAGAGGANDVTKQGNANFTDQAGVSTTSGTDRTLVDVGDSVITSVNFTPGAGITQADFYLYREDFAASANVIEGSDFTKVQGNTATTDGTDLVFYSQGRYGCTPITFSAGDTYRVEFLASTEQVYSQQEWIICSVVDRTAQPDAVVAQQIVPMNTGTPSVACALTWVPKNNHDYGFRFEVGGLLGYLAASPITFDQARYGIDPGSNVATIEIYDSTNLATMETKDVVVDATTSDALVGSVVFTSVAATNYKAIVTRSEGTYPITVDKAVLRPLSATAWTLDDLDFGLGPQTSGVFTPWVWAVGHAAATDTTAFVYDADADRWKAGIVLDSSNGSNLTVLAMAHTDVAEYFLLSSNEVVRSTAPAADFTGAADTITYTTIPAAVGMAYAQDRLFVLSEGSGGTVVYSSPPIASNTNITTDANTRSTIINAGAKTPDTALRQRMCSTPTGARFFINYGDVTAKIYEVDSSGTGLEPRELADLGHGIKATSIAHEAGVTFIGAQYFGDAAASDTDKLPRAVLFLLDQNGAVQRIGFFRRDDPDPNPPVYMVPYQTHLYILQGKYVWRYDLVRGGLFLEYELEPKNASHQRALAILFGQIFALYTDEVFVAGSVGTYRQSSVMDGSTYASSIYDFGLPFVRKTLAKIHVLADDLPIVDGTPSTRVTVEYQVDQDDVWIQAGEMSVGSEATFYITDTSFTTLQVRVRLATTNGTTTPVLHAVTVWASSAQDEEYFDLVLLTEDYDSSFRVANDQSTGDERVGSLLQYWRSKSVLTFRDGYQSQGGDFSDYLTTIEDLRIENNAAGEGRAVLTLKVVR